MRRPLPLDAPTSPAKRHCTPLRAFDVAGRAHEFNPFHPVAAAAALLRAEAEASGAIAQVQLLRPPPPPEERLPHVMRLRGRITSQLLTGLCSELARDPPRLGVLGEYTRAIARRIAIILPGAMAARQVDTGDSMPLDQTGAWRHGPARLRPDHGREGEAWGLVTHDRATLRVVVCVRTPFRLCYSATGHGEASRVPMQTGDIVVEFAPSRTLYRRAVECDPVEGGEGRYVIIIE